MLHTRSCTSVGVEGATWTTGADGAALELPQAHAPNVPFPFQVWTPFVIEEPEGWSFGTGTGRTGRGVSSSNGPERVRNVARRIAEPG